MMQCPNCHFEPVPEGARECPNCHTPLPAGRSVQVDVQAQQNLGTLIGVQAGQLNGDVYGNNIVYVLSAAGRAAGSGSFFQKGSLPYKSLAAYTARDSLIFKGRERETAQLVGRISEQAVLTLYGPSGVGKTSLLAAGAIPRLTEAGAAVVHLRDYQRPLADSLRDGLAACAREAPIPLPAQGDLTEVVKAVREGLQGTLVLILDQAEALLDGHAGVGAELARALDAVDWQYLRIIFAVRESELPKLDGLRADLPDVLRNSLPLFALDTAQAREAILEPLGRLDSPFHYEIGFDQPLVDVLLTDLDDLSQDTPGRIFPPHLQIVCDRLYREARENNQREIDQALYVERLHGADEILAKFVEEQLGQFSPAQQPAARSVLARLADRPGGGWRAADELVQTGGAPDTGEKRVTVGILKGLVERGLVLERPVNSHHEYALTSEVLALEIRKRLGSEAAAGYDPEGELERLWSGWLASGDLPGEAQMLRLQLGLERCRHTGAQALLMLRSAARLNLDLAPWLAWLRSSPDGAALVRRLEGLEGGGAERSNLPTHLEKARRMLQFSELPGPPGGWPQKSFGQLAWAAVRSADPAVRQAAGLALLLPADGGGLNRIDEATFAADGHSAPRADLRGAMAEADAEMEAKNRRLPLWDRVRIHAWRTARRMRVDRQRLTWLCIGGGLGAGLGLGLLRGLTAALVHYTVGIHAFMNFGFGFLLGAALMFGMLLGEYLLPASGKAGAPTPRGRVVISILLGGVLFGLAAVVVALSSGALALAGKEMVITAGFEVGIALAVGLYPFPYLGERLDLAGRGWPLRIVAVGLLFAAAHWGFIWLGRFDLSAVIIWPGSLYRAELARYALLPVWQQLQGLPGWFNGVAMLDAFLTGAVLCAGELIALRLAGSRLRRGRA